ncbi:hypothetical protein ACTQ3M_09055 [Oscillospiraceae bacterium LCP25S3_E10]|nr:hypothetical protein [Ruminococcus sp.]
MKKFITVALISALALSASITAFAADPTTITPDTDGNPAPNSAPTTVNLNIAPTYTVTIPADITLNETKKYDGAGKLTAITYENDLLITAEAVRLAESKKIEVTMESDFNLDTAASSEYKLPYTVKVDDSTEDLINGGTVALFGTNTAEQTSILHFSANNPVYAGDYSDNVTFTIKLV